MNNEIEVLSIGQCPYEKYPKENNTTTSTSTNTTTNTLSLLSRTFFNETHRSINKYTYNLYILKIINLFNCKKYNITKNTLENNIKILNKLSHKTIVSYYSSYFIQETKEYYLIIPYIDGLSLNDIIWKLPQTELDIQFKWMKQVYSGLEYLHYNCNISHGKLIPQNIIIESSSNNVKIVGIDAPCLRLPFNRENFDNFVNVSYLSYERYNGLDYDEYLDDIWATGLIFAELLLGLKRHHKHFNNSNNHHNNHNNNNYNHNNENNNKSDNSIRLNDITNESLLLRQQLISDCLETSPQIGLIIELSLIVPQKNNPITSAIINQKINQLCTNSSHKLTPSSISSLSPLSSLSDTSSPIPSFSPTSPSPLPVPSTNLPSSSSVLPISTPAIVTSSLTSRQISLLPTTITSTSPQPLLNFGGGDVIFIENFLEEDTLNELMNNVQNEVSWYQLKHPVHCSCYPRLTSFQALIEDDGTIPIYRCADPQPWDNQYETINFTPIIRKLKEKIELISGETYNWCRMINYRTDNDDMGFHSDKYLDISKDSYIVSFSIGQTREYILKLKKGIQLHHKLKYHLSTDNNQRISLTHNSLLLLGPTTNMCYLHSISKNHNHNHNQKIKNNLYDYRISITFRKIATFYCPRFKGLDNNCFYGQGISNIPTKFHLMLKYYMIVFNRHIQTISIGFFTYFISLIIQNFCYSNSNSNSHKSPNNNMNMNVIFSSFVSLLYRYFAVSNLKSKHKLNKWRHMIVYRLLNILPLNPFEAVRLLDNASHIELETLSQYEKGVKHPSESTQPIAQPMIYSLHSVDEYNDYEDLNNQQHITTAATSTKHQHKKHHKNRKNHDIDHEYAIDEKKNVEQKSYLSSITLSSLQYQRKKEFDPHSTSSTSLYHYPIDSSSSQNNGNNNNNSNNSNSNNSKVHSNISVCIIVDVINDFLLTTGEYCKVFGIDDTHRFRLIHPTIIDIYRYCHQHNIQVILVTSHYCKNQFRRVSDLCTTDYGRQFCLPLYPSTEQEQEHEHESEGEGENNKINNTNNNNNNKLNDIIHVKFNNSILECSDESKSTLFNIIQNKTILICGVTTVCCIQYAVNDLL